MDSERRSEIGGNLKQRGMYMYYRFWGWTPCIGLGAYQVL